MPHEIHIGVTTETCLSLILRIKTAKCELDHRAMAESASAERGGSGPPGSGSVRFESLITGHRDGRELQMVFHLTGDF
jgi:hypothetical protein